MTLFREVLGLILIASVSFGDAFDEQLFELNRLGGLGAKTSEIVPQYERFLSEYTAPDQMGRTYAQLAETLCKGGLTDPDSVIQYAKKALEYPLDPSVNMQVYVCYGDALQVKNRGVTGDALKTVRGDIAKTYLEGIKTGIDNGVPDEEIPLTRLAMINAIVNSPAVQEEEKKHAEIAAANEKTRQLNKLVKRRETLENQVVFLYTRQPYDTEELKKIATDVLNNDAAVQRLVAKVETGISQRGVKEQDRAAKAVVHEVNKVTAAMPVASAGIPPSAPEKKTTSKQPVQTQSVPTKIQTPSYGWVYWMVAALLAIIVVGIAGIRTNRSKLSKNDNKTI